MPADDDLPVNDRLTIPAAELSLRFSRSSGPGGQGVNTTDSRVELSVDLARVLPDWLRDRAFRRLGDRLAGAVLTVVASEHRSQLRNREAARARLAAVLADAVAPPAPPRRPTRPSRRAQDRRISQKKARGETKRLRGRPEE